MTTLLYALGLSDEDILSTFYKSIRVRETKLGWKVPFATEKMRGLTPVADLVDAKSGEVVAKAGEKITAKRARELAEERVAGRDAPVGRGDADEGPADLGVREPEAAQEGAVRRPVEALHRDARRQDRNGFAAAGVHFSEPILSCASGGNPMTRICAFLLFVVFSAAVSAQGYPTRSIRIVVPFGVGGPADIYARFVGAKIGDAMGQSVVVENRPGGGAVIGSDAVAKSPPDGYTLLMMSNTHTVNETLIPKKPYALMKDLAPITGVNYSDLLMVVHPTVQPNNLKELIAQAKAHPGKLNYASSGPGTPYHMAGELFKHMAGVDIVHVPYKGSDGARAGILGAQVHMMLDAITTMAPNVRAGKVKAMGTTGRSRSACSTTSWIAWPWPNAPAPGAAGRFR